MRELETLFKDSILPEKHDRAALLNIIIKDLKNSTPRELFSNSETILGKVLEEIQDFRGN